MDRLPPLNTLKTFETAARHLSFTTAASELHVTPSAISHQIKLLEDCLGVRLFRREHNHLLLTEAGHYLLPECREAFSLLAQSIQDTRRLGTKRQLTLVLRPYFAQKWLMPRLSSFWQAHPEIDLRLQHSTQPPAPALEGCDAAIVWGNGDFGDLQSHLLVNGDLTPVCSPSLWQSIAQPSLPQALAGQVLLDEETPDNWDSWLQLGGDSLFSLCQSNRRISIDDTNVRLYFALSGKGFMLTCLSLLEPELTKGALLAPFPLVLPAWSYYLVWRADALQTPSTLAFIDWLKQQSRAEE